MKKTIKQRIFGYNGFFSELPINEQLFYWSKIVRSLEALDISSKKIERYKKAFDYFSKGEGVFDGSTFVKDLFIVKTKHYDKFGKRIVLDINAMLHDYEYLTGAYYSFKDITKSNLEYVKNIQACGQGLHWDRFVGLSIISVFYVPYRNITRILKNN